MKSLFKKNKKVIIGLGAAVVVVTSMLIKVAEGPYITEDIESDEPAEFDEMPTPAHCADGWSSESIGKQGACSHHGGVAA